MIFSVKIHIQEPNFNGCLSLSNCLSGRFSLLCRTPHVGDNWVLEQSLWPVLGCFLPDSTHRLCVCVAGGLPCKFPIAEAGHKPVPYMYLKVTLNFR